MLVFKVQLFLLPVVPNYIHMIETLEIGKQLYPDIIKVAGLQLEGFDDTHFHPCGKYGGESTAEDGIAYGQLYMKRYLSKYRVAW